MKEVILNMKEQAKYEAIKELVDHGGNKKGVSLKLDITVRQVNRLIKVYKEKGKSGFVHGNRSRKPKNKLDDLISNNILLLYKTKYYDFNISHFKIFLEEKENIKVSYSCIYNILKKADILSPYAQRKTKKAAKKKELLKQKVITEETDNNDVEIIVNREISLEDSHPRKEKPKFFGEIIEEDGSIHNWFGDKKSCLHLAIDKATSIIVGAYFDKEETLHGYYQVLRQILKEYGVPFRFFTDNRTVFNYKSLDPDKRTSDKDVLTQYGYACKQLGIEIKTSSVSQAKGTIERANGSFQRMLVQELRLANITDIEEANKYLIETFVPAFNKRFARNPKDFDSVFGPIPTDETINYTLAILTPRKIDNGNSIKFKNKFYQPYEGDNLKCFLPKTECLVIEALNGELLVSVDGVVFNLKELNRNAKISENFDIEEKKPNVKTERKPKYKPSIHHPWKCSIFQNHVRDSHIKHHYT